ncbi:MULTISPECIES: hypothetical protein [Flavobacterium]|uniref:Uncharacterized protein n=1 Tax=Flavobacterium hankyongi TaxID=1176532 RepID=A0ABP8ZJX3_9FLAO|nr:hypothetical protein [Flavobacterium sp. N1846]
MTKERNFTIAKLEFRKLTDIDLLYITGYTIIVIANLFLDKGNNFNIKLQLTLFSSVVIGMQTCTTPFGLRFRNVYFSLIWFSLSLLFLINSYSLCYIPLITFIAYHIIRLVFWFRYDRELIPFFLAKGGSFRYKSKIENKAGNKNDRNFTYILCLIWACYFILTLGGIINETKKNKVIKTNKKIELKSNY